jgi:methionyl aminopeptidase
MNAVKSFSEHQLIALQDDEWLERQRIAGRSVIFCLDAARSMINNRFELSVSALRSEMVILMKTFGCTHIINKEKSQKSSIKIYVNSITDLSDDSYKFKDGDIIKIEAGANHFGSVAKSTITIIKGNPKSKSHLEMIQVCKKSLNNAISQIHPGKRIGCVGAGINHVIKSTLFKLFSENAGYGLDVNNISATPSIPNKSQSNSGIRIQEGMTFTVAPQITLSSTSEIGCCFEKTVFIRNNNIEIITPFSEGN